MYRVLYSFILSPQLATAIICRVRLLRASSSDSDSPFGLKWVSQAGASRMFIVQGGDVSFGEPHQGRRQGSRYVLTVGEVW